MRSVAVYNFAIIFFIEIEKRLNQVMNQHLNSIIGFQSRAEFCQILINWRNNEDIFQIFIDWVI
jgi:hypothetical protein